MNINLSNIIEDIKKQRMDIVRLNNELKNSRYMMDQRNHDDMRNRQEFNRLYKKQQQETAYLQQQFFL